MAHFAELDDNNTVLRVIVVNNEVITIEEVENEQLGIDFCHDLFGGSWIQTSYNATIRKNFACIGFFYDETLDAFIAPKCHNEAILNETTAQWNCENEEHHVIS